MILRRLARLRVQVRRSRKADAPAGHARLRREKPAQRRMPGGVIAGAAERRTPFGAQQAADCISLTLRRIGPDERGHCADMGCDQVVPPIEAHEAQVRATLRRKTHL
ncbi:hypothetical protein [Ancylobacter terrae]|uniref:hypothetical protein n=1 Tax=Ancylobacter sp. sgz301288 TaxID=3342077 RepID=UPI00385EFC1C